MNLLNLVRMIRWFMVGQAGYSCFFNDQTIYVGPPSWPIASICRAHCLFWSTVRTIFSFASEHVAKTGPLSIDPRSRALIWICTCSLICSLSNPWPRESKPACKRAPIPRGEFGLAVAWLIQWKQNSLGVLTPRDSSTVQYEIVKRNKLRVPCSVSGKEELR